MDSAYWSFDRRSFIHAQVGVYEARCNCCKFFQAPIEGVPYKGHYSNAVRNAVANAVIRDRMPYELVQKKMREDHVLDLSIGYVHFCFEWAHEQIHTEAYWDFVKANFSCILCIDEVHDGAWTILFATDPLNDFTVSFQLVEQNDQDHFEKMITFLEWENVERTNNHVERNNRSLRMMQKTRYKRRKKHTIQMALELNLYARMLEHPLYQKQPDVRPIRLPDPHTKTHKIAA